MGFQIVATAPRTQDVEFLSNISHARANRFGQWLDHMHPGLSFAAAGPATPLVTADYSTLAFILTCGYNGSSMSLVQCCDALKGLQPLTDAFLDYFPVDQELDDYIGLAFLFRAALEYAVGNGGELHLI